MKVRERVKEKIKKEGMATLHDSLHVGQRQQSQLTKGFTPYVQIVSLSVSCYFLELLPI